VKLCVHYFGIARYLIYANQRSDVTQIWYA